MVKLISRSAFSASLPTTIGGVTVDAPDDGPVTSIAPFKGQESKVARLFDGAWPGANTQINLAQGRLLWVSPVRALLIGAPSPDIAGLAATTDQTGAEAVLHLRGADAPDVLARLVPMDLRLASFAPNTTARTLIGHMTGSVTRLSEETIELRVMRSMAETLLRDVTEAAEHVTARH